MFDLKFENTVTEWFNDLSESKQIGLWNEYCERNIYTDDVIYTMDIVENDLRNHNGWDLLTTHVVDFDCFNPNDEYAVATNYGWKSSDDPNDLVEWTCDVQFLEYLWEWYVKDEEDIE